MMTTGKLAVLLQRKAVLLGWSIRHFASDLRAVAAIEFAFLVPLMLLLYVGTIELSGAVSANRKLSRTSLVIGDLITQTNCYTNSDIEDIMKIADDIMYPYDDALTIVITAIRIEDGDGEVVWSRANGSGADAPGAPYSVPKTIATEGTFLIATRVAMNYQPAVGWITYGSHGELSRDQTAMDMQEQMFLRPRDGNNIEIKGAC